jgi:glycosidase
VNAAEPKVLSHYLEVIGHFANLGQMGTRMDAIVHMGKTPGTFNINNPASQAFMALTKAFASHVAPGNMFLPEANLPWDDAKRDWLDPQARFDGKVENVAGDALISFDVHKATWDTLLRGDKAAWLDVQRGLGELPANKSLLVYLGLHDETLIEDPALRQMLIDKGAHDFAGRGVGDSPAALLDGDADRLAMAHVLLYASKGHPAVYYRTLVGAPNDDAFFAAKTQQRLDAQQRAGEQPDPTRSKDTRDLDRGPVARADYDKALREGYKPAVTVRALNALWDRNGAVRTNHIAEVSSSERAVVSLARTAADGTDPPLLQLVNLAGDAKTVVLSAADLARQLGWQGLASGKLVDLLASEIDGVKRTVDVRVDGASVVVRLAPYQSVYLQHG